VSFQFANDQQTTTLLSFVATFKLKGFCQLLHLQTIISALVFSLDICCRVVIPCRVRTFLQKAAAI
jgi:hypothetical protein